MNDLGKRQHLEAADLLPLYVSGSLEEGQRRQVERHLPGCPECQADLALWENVAGEIAAADRSMAAPPALIEDALVRIHERRRCPAAPARAVQLLQAQALLVRREIWPASAAVIAIGYLAAMVTGSAAVIRVLAPLMAAASIAVLYGQDNDPALELALASPTSPRQILLARLALVFGYDLILALAASIGLLPILPEGMLGSLVLGWLGPMTFLSAAALVLSLWVGTGNAVALAYLAWLAQFLSGGLLNDPSATIGTTTRLALDFYQQFWGSPSILLSLSALMLAAALWTVGRLERCLPRWAS